MARRRRLWRHLRFACPRSQPGALLSASLAFCLSMPSGNGELPERPLALVVLLQLHPLLVPCLACLLPCFLLCCCLPACPPMETEPCPRGSPMPVRPVRSWNHAAVLVCFFAACLPCSLPAALLVPRLYCRNRDLTRAAPNPRGQFAVATGMDLVRPALLPCSASCAVPCFLLCLPCSLPLLTLLPFALTAVPPPSSALPVVPSLAAASSSMQWDGNVADLGRTHQTVQ
jgi:hypothetical protein